jgi:hypothetical protein
MSVRSQAAFNLQYKFEFPLGNKTAPNRRVLLNNYYLVVSAPEGSRVDSRKKKQLSLLLIYLFKIVS